MKHYIYLLKLQCADREVVDDIPANKRIVINVLYKTLSFIQTTYSKHFYASPSL